MKNWTQYLEENQVILTEMTVEIMVDKCIKEGKDKEGALEYAKVNDFPKQVSEILRRLPKSMFENMVEAEVTFEELMEDYEGDLTAMIDDYLSEDLDDLDEEVGPEFSNKFDEENDEMEDDDEDDEDKKNKKKKKKSETDDDKEFEMDDEEDKKKE